MATSVLKYKAYKYFITAPLFYINGFPHIGHVYTIAVADAINRYKRMTLKTKNTIFLTGVDEHGEKIQFASIEAGQKFDGYCQSMADTFQDVFESFNHTINVFKRTSHSAHIQKVQKTFKILQRRDYIYKDTYEGYYSMIDQAFVPKSQVETKADGRHFAQKTGEELSLLKEECYMFALQKFKAKILNWLCLKKPVYPLNFNNDAIQMLEELDEDLCISRPADKVNWAIFVPNDISKTIYIWFDALLAYNDVPRLNSAEDFFIKQQADCHVFGKDILKFHSIYLPAFQLAIDYNLPSQLICHSHWLRDNSKMSKSKGNVATPLKEVRHLTHEGLRYYLLRAGTLNNDTNYDRKAAINCVNAELVNKLVNLVWRSLSSKINPNQIIPTSYSALEKPDVNNLIQNLNKLPETCRVHYEQYNFHNVVDAVMSTLDQTNKLFHDREPWKQTSKEIIQDTLTTTFEVARICSIILQPIVPTITSKILDKLNVPNDQRFWDDTKVQISPLTSYRYAKSDKEKLFERVGMQ